MQRLLSLQNKNR
ncbi:hypothetical protein Nmel_003013, partial [Mimus melanotis]